MDNDKSRDWVLGLRQADVLRLLSNEATRQIAGEEIRFTRLASTITAALAYLVENTPEQRPEVVRTPATPDRPIRRGPGRPSGAKNKPKFTPEAG